MFLRITTTCAFAGTDTEHLVEVPDDTSPEDIQAIIDEYIIDDIQPDGGYEIIPDDEIEEVIEDTGMEVEQR